jgi:hypothetical protein
MPSDPTTVPMRTSILLGGRGVAGGVDGRGEPASTWREAMMTGRVLPSGAGAGHRRDATPILEAVLGLGVDEVLVRAEWARLSPAEGVVDEGEVGWLADQLRALRAEGRRTGLVLTDGAVPSWMGPEAWLMPATAERLSRLAVELVQALDGLVDVMIPIEEPGAWCLAGWVAGVAPPLRVGAVSDALAALDGMLAGQLLSEVALAEAGPGVEVAWLASTGLGQEAERAVLGQQGNGSVIDRVLRPAARRSPGRALGLAASAGGAHGAILPFGADAPSPIAPFASVVWSGAAAVAPLAVLVSAALDSDLPGSGGLRMVHSSAVIDERGRVSRLRGHLRLDRLASAIEEARRRGTVRRLIVGEATDRWRWGSFRSREGIFAVDRTRGSAGYELDALDAAGIDAGGGLAALLSHHSD